MVRWPVVMLACILVAILIHSLRGVSRRSGYFGRLVPSLGSAAADSASSSAAPTSAPHHLAKVISPPSSAPLPLLNSSTKPRIDYASLLSPTTAYTGATHRLSLNATRARNMTATFRSVAGYPVCEWRSMCMWAESRERFLGGSAGPLFTVVPNVSAEVDALSSAADRDCFPTRVNKGNKMRSWSNEVQADLLARMGWTPSDVVWLPGTTYIIDTYLLTAHFDHVGARAVQSRMVLDALARADDTPDRIMMFKQSRYPSTKRPLNSPLTLLVIGALGPRWLAHNVSVFRSDIEKWRVVCMDRALEVRHVSERKFANQANLDQWSRVVQAWNPGDVEPPGKCPSARAPVLVLNRVEGMGMRAIGNFDALERAFKELGVCGYRNSSVGSSMPFEAQVRLFANFSLLVSAHSSQLVNLLWAHPLSATLELRPDKGELPVPENWWKRFPSPFCPAYLWCACVAACHR